MHIFWQKRIRAKDTTTPWWYPSQTGGGEIREDRVVFPIMPGVHWQDVGPILLTKNEDTQLLTEATDTPVAEPKVRKRRSKTAESASPVVPPVQMTKTVLVWPNPMGGFWFAEQGVAKEVALPPEEAPAETIVEKPKRSKATREKTKIDPQLLAMSREVRDRWGERNEAIRALRG